MDDTARADRIGAPTQTTVELPHPALPINIGPDIAVSNDGNTVYVAYTNGGLGVASRLYLTRPDSKDEQPDPDVRVLKSMKANYGTIGGEIRMRWANGVLTADASESWLDQRGIRY